MFIIQLRLLFFYLKTGYVAQTLERPNSNPITYRGGVKGSVLPLLVNSCADLLMVDLELLSCVQHTPTFVRIL